MTDELRAADYAAMAKEAEAAVASVKDAELRRVAFEKILHALLEKGAAGPAKSRVASRNERAKGQQGTKRSRPAGNSRHGPKTRIEALVDDGFFKKPRTIAEVKAELANRGHHIALTSISGPLQRLTQERRLRRQKAAASGKGTKLTYAYSNW